MIPRRPSAIILTAFAAEVFGMAAIVSFPALTPLLVPLWHLSAPAAGWISGVYFLGYAVSAPLFGTLGDRHSARGVFLWSMAGGVATTLAFALLAEGAWSAGILRFAQGVAQGVAFAGIHMPGMKALTEAVPDRWQERAAAAFTATFPVGAGLSFLVSGGLADWLGWHEAMLLLAAGPAVGWAIGLAALPQTGRQEATPPPRGLLGMLRNPGVLAHVLTYFLHNGEASTMRSWIVAFLAFASAGTAGGPLSLPDLALIATVANLLGLPGIALGVAATRWLRRTIVIALIMPTSAAIGIGLGLSAGGPVWLSVGLALLYGLAAPADSGLINAGLIARVPAAYRGRMLALQGMSGMSGGFALPVVFGALLGWFGGAGSQQAWIFAFAVQAVLLLCGPVILLTLARDR